MKIYTGTGDRGSTSLVGGSRVSKADVRLEAYGTADELNSFIGLLLSKYAADETTERELLLYLQNKLFNLGTLLATEPESDKQKMVEELYLSEQDVQRLEKAIDSAQEGLPLTRGFILPSGNERVSLCHVCRTITRRLERRMTSLMETEDRELTTAELTSLKFVNRMSDYFFILAKKTAQKDKCEIFLWKK